MYGEARIDVRGDRVTVCCGAVLAVLVAGCATTALDRQVTLCARDPAGGACKVAADAFRQGTAGAPRHLGAAAALYQRACSRGRARGCTQLALFAEVGDGILRDSQLAARLFGSACQLGDGWACGRLGSLHRGHRGGGGVSQDLGEAAHLFRQGCVGGDAWSCGALARALEDGSGVPKDPLAASVLYHKACKGGMLWACNEIPRTTRHAFGEEAWWIRVRGAIRARWDAKQLSRQIHPSPTDRLEVSLRVSLDRAGVVQAIVVEEPALDAINVTCADAVRAAQPFPDPPESRRRGDTFEVTIGCRYEPGPPKARSQSQAPL